MVVLSMWDTSTRVDRKRTGERAGSRGTFDGHCALWRINVWSWGRVCCLRLSCDGHVECASPESDRAPRQVVFVTDGPWRVQYT